MGLFSGSVRYNRSMTDRIVACPIGRNNKGERHIGMSVVCSVFVVSVVSGHDKFTYVSSVAKVCMAFLMASPAAIIKVSNSVSTTLSMIVSLASVFASSTHRIWTPSVAVSSFR